MLRLACCTLLLLSACTGFRDIGGDIYRSPQPGEEQLTRRIAQNNIRTVVCLRGDGQGSGVTERVAAGAGVRFEHVPMSARRLPKPETLLHLWRVAAEAPRPILLHCRAGVDRTGLASALLVLHDTDDLDRARAELSVWNGHLAWFGTGAMDEVLDDYAPFAGRMSFPDWVREVYSQRFAAVAR